MRIRFQQTSPLDIIQEISRVLGDRELSKIVNFKTEGLNLIVTISKMGVSSLNFTGKTDAQGIEYTLIKEKIALSHKLLKDEVKAKILKVIKDAGGRITEG